jgi:signal transduction histidine kinase
MEKAASMGNLIGGIAHNIKTPLMGCSGAIDIIGSRIFKLKDIIDTLNENEDENLKKEVNDIADNIILWQSRIKDYLNYIGDVINTVKDQVAPANRMEKFTIGDLVNRISILMKNRLKEKKCAIIYKIELQRDYEVHGEISYLIQALNNLIDNAIDAYADKPGEIEFNIKQEGNNILFSVKDYGYGISNEISSKLFNQMITTKGKDGSGLGLYMSKILIKSKLEGDIYFKTNADKGTEFIILIPERK